MSTRSIPPSFAPQASGAQASIPRLNHEKTNITTYGLHLKKIPLFTNVIPSKLFESMGMGIPVLHGVAGESAELVEREGVGIVFEPENSTSLSEEIVRLRTDVSLYQNLKANCINAASRYDRRKLAASMLDVLVEVANEPVANLSDR